MSDNDDNDSNGWDTDHDSYYDQGYNHQYDQDLDDTLSINSSLLESLDNDVNQDEITHDQHPIQNRSHCIGIYFTQYDNDWRATGFVFMQRISTTMFYKYSSNILEEYLIDFLSHTPYNANDELLVNHARIEIIQIHFEYPHTHHPTETETETTETITTTLEPSYGVVSKTIWLKLIQREWKKVHQKTKKINEENLKKCCLPINHLYSQIHGHYPHPLTINTRPSIKGLMKSYTNPNHQKPRLNLLPHHRHI